MSRHSTRDHLASSESGGADKKNDNSSPPELPYTVLSEKDKISTILIASFAGFLSPISASIYFPALNTLADHLNVSATEINLSITVYMIFQALAPTLVGNYSDNRGRRPALLICFTIYIGANIGLALQHSYPTLMILRCLQSSGSSGTLVISSAVTADLVTRAERGKYLAYSSMGATAGQALGPVIGGLIVQFSNAQSIFWFLTAFASFMVAVVLLFLPETSRPVVGNGSISPQKWNHRVLDLAYPRRAGHKQKVAGGDTRPPLKRRPSPLETFKICGEKETAIILLFIALLFCGYATALSTLPSQLERKYGFNSLQIGLCCLPYAFGSLTSRWTVGFLTDWNFRRHAHRLGIKIVKNRQTDLAELPVELARLQITLPLVCISSVFIVTYSWVMAYETNLSGPLIMLCLAGHAMSGAINTLITLLVDCHVQRPATAIAASNLFRCLIGAGAVAAATPLINAIGIGWAGTVLALIWVILAPLLWAAMKRGHGWRREEKRKRDEGAILGNA
ncbi:major facilitator superfamily domain-containing protein [Aspergillus alliaceus]|uniref:Major facilitator superfamily domain-containing protein n=1 Tax=Petromyces alliaceus TaxID=209559 RepID=A0A5N7C0S4_PETAA|nr:major facilitator superfamily domain-containing protein [Aspergillus alliaceus]